MQVTAANSIWTTQFDTLRKRKYQIEEYLD